MREIWKGLLALLERGEDAVLVTVASAQGSTPRGAGAQLLAGRDGLAAGTVGGGPGEAQVLALAAELLEGVFPEAYEWLLEYAAGLGDPEILEAAEDLRK